MLDRDRLWGAYAAPGDDLRIALRLDFADDPRIIDGRRDRVRQRVGAATSGQLALIPAWRLAVDTCRCRFYFGCDLSAGSNL